MPSDLATALATLERATEAAHAATRAVLQLARTQARAADARAADPDEWTRLPAGRDRCPVSRWSRSTLHRRIKSRSIRGKTVDGSSYYSLTDVRHLISRSPISSTDH